MRRAKRRDANEAAIVEALEAAGAYVQRLDDSGGGVPDLLVGYRGVTKLLEVKLPLGPRGGVHHHGKPGSSGDMTPAQVRWWADWCGEPPLVVRTPAEALAAIGVAS